MKSASCTLGTDRESLVSRWGIWVFPAVSEPLHALARVYLLLVSICVRLGSEHESEAALVGATPVLWIQGVVCSVCSAGFRKLQLPAIGPFCHWQ